VTASSPAPTRLHCSPGSARTGYEFSLRTALAAVTNYFVYIQGALLGCPTGADGAPLELIEGRQPVRALRQPSWHTLPIPEGLVIPRSKPNWALPPPSQPRTANAAEVLGYPRMPSNSGILGIRT